MQVTTSVISSEMSRKGDQYWSFPSSKSFHGFDEGHTNKTERCIRGAARAWANIPNDVWIVETELFCISCAIWMSGTSDIAQVCIDEQSPKACTQYGDSYLLHLLLPLHRWGNISSKALL